MTSRLAYIQRLAVTLSLFLLLGGCGGESDKDKAAKARYRKALATYKSDLSQWKEDQVQYDECTSSIDDFRRKIKALNGRLSVGLSYDAYSTEVGDVSAVYSNSDFSGGGLDCLGDVGVPLEGALNQYRKAYNIWNKCFEDYACDADSITPDLQGHWSKASDLISESDSGLEDLQVGPRPQPPRKPAALRD